MPVEGRSIAGPAAGAARFKTCGRRWAASFGGRSAGVVVSPTLSAGPDLYAGTYCRFHSIREVQLHCSKPDVG